jgi:ectoine hydroxylase-related dioxygenase (phytanoyl-CoA dioxygenase family)
VSNNPDLATIDGKELQAASLSSWLADIEENGYTVIPNWLDSARVHKLGNDLHREVMPISELMPPDNTTVRVHNLLAKTRCVDDLVCDERLLALVNGHLGPHVQVSAVAMFDLLPGSKAQSLHQDDGLWPIARPHAPIVINGVIAVDDFTAENGATVLVPHSHKWDDTPVRQPPDVDTIQVEMKAGSMVIWDGAMWHGGGANISEGRSRLAIFVSFNLSYLRQQENQYIGVPREQVAKMPKRLQRLIGYQHGAMNAGPGMVDLRDPLIMLDKVEFGYNVNDPHMPNIG